MSAEGILQALEALRAEVWVAGSDLRIRAPGGAISDELRRSIREHKQVLIDRLGSGGTAGIAPTWHGEDSDLSYMQEGMWYFSKAGVASAYNVVAAYHLEGPLDHAAMRRSINSLVARHPMLRGFVVEEDGQPRLRYARSLEVELPVDDLTSLPEDEGMRECHDRIRAEYFHDFDVGTPPLHYFRLFKLSDADWVLYCNLHHMLTDAFSFSVIVRELAEGYAADTAGREPEFPTSTVQFPDWIAWQRRECAGARIAGDLDYWKKTLQKPLPSFDLVPDRPRKRAFDLSGADFPFEIAESRWQRLAEVAHSVRATPFMVVMASLKLAIYYLTGSKDVIVGTPVSGRMHPSLKHLIGAFLNTLPVRTQVDPKGTLQDFLAAVRKSMLGALAHQRAPFREIVRSLELPHDPSRTPVYQVSLNLWDISDRPDAWGTLEGTRFHVSTPWTHAEFAMWLMSSSGAGVHGNCTYATELFERESGLRLGEAVQQVLDLFSTDPLETIEEITLVTDRERADWARWNATDRSWPTPRLLHELVLDTASEIPEHEAIRDDRGALSYAEVEVQSARIAAALRARGIARGDLVAVIIEREARILPLLLGILRAGAGYVPLDPEFPVDRSRFIIDDARAALVVCTSETSALVPTGSARLDLDDALASELDGGDDDGVRPSDVAYVIYTSGSTGRPKGVRVTHANVVNFLNAMREQPGLTRGDVVLAATTFAFDISVLELYLPLIVGARVVLASRDDVLYPESFVAKLTTWRPTVIQATPSFWAMLFDAGWEGDAALKVLTGGEALPIDLATRLFESVDELWNMYGPTETTVWSTAHRVRASDLGLPSVPLGRPIANTSVLVVDERLRPVPTGSPGELLIGGAGVSAGYHDRPDLVLQRFTDVGGYGRMYRTGDRVRFRHTGELEFLGRLDWQLKMRGHRIEPGEIEVVLRGHPQVHDAVVGAVDFAAGDQRLVAWIAAESQTRATPTELRAHLRKSLPNYMIPSLFVDVDEIPKTPNGKTDRLALPQPSLGVARTEIFNAPRPGTEELVAAVWRKQLQVSSISRDANFFEIGGHSLLSVRVVAELERQTGYRLDPRLMFFNSLEQVAATLDEAIRSVPAGAR